MSITHINNLKNFLAKIGAEPKKSLSQNFLVDPHCVQAIVNLIPENTFQQVIEIGSGPGALTEELLRRFPKNTISIEKDDLFAPQLSRLSSDLKIIHNDVMLVNLQELATPLFPTCLIGNLPYHLTTPIIEKFLIEAPSCTQGIFMVQDEVALRICAEPNTSDYGSLSVFVRAFTQPTYCFKVEKNSFYPPPKIDSAIISLKRNPIPFQAPPEFFTFVQKTFGQRRKMLRASLKQDWDTSFLSQAFEKAQIEGTKRPQELTIDDFFRLFSALHSSS